MTATSQLYILSWPIGQIHQKQQQCATFIYHAIGIYLPKQICPLNATYEN